MYLSVYVCAWYIAKDAIRWLIITWDKPNLIMANRILFHNNLLYRCCFFIAVVAVANGCCCSRCYWASIIIIISVAVSVSYLTNTTFFFFLLCFCPSHSCFLQWLKSLLITEPHGFEFDIRNRANDHESNQTNNVNRSEIINLCKI